jgi:hypothetical protein
MEGAMKLGFVAFTLALVGAIPVVQAAPPQILGLVATAEPTPLLCINGVCSAEFSSFCLERFRPSPETGTAYRFADDAKLTLRVTGADGAVREIDALPLVTVDSERIYAAVRISLPLTRLDDPAPVTVALSVGEAVAIIPETTGDVDQPMDEREIADYSGPLRREADPLYDSRSESAVAAATALKLLNAHHRQASKERVDIEALWQNVVGAPPSEDSPDGVQRIYRALTDCSNTPRIFDLCMETLHENAISESNSRVWQGLGAGS